MDVSPHQEQDHTHVEGFARRPQTEESGKLGVGGSGNLGKGPKASHSLKKKALGSSTNSTHAVPVKHPHKIFPVTLHPDPKPYANLRQPSRPWMFALLN
jgi:hypothetical protein